MDPISIDLGRNPDLQFRIDTFNVPAAVRAEFDAVMQRNFAFIRTLPGFRGHLVFEKTGGNSAFNVVTIAVWESAAAIENALTQVRAYYQSIGFDPREATARWGVTAELGEYRGLQPAPVGATS